MVSMVRATTCVRAFSWRNDTDSYAFFSCSWWLSLLSLRQVQSNSQRLSCDSLWGNPHTRTPLESQQMVAITFPAENMVFAFFLGGGFRRPWVTPQHWRKLALGRQVMHPLLFRCGIHVALCRIKLKNGSSNFGNYNTSENFRVKILKYILNY